MYNPTLDARQTPLSAADLAALRENLHEQRLFRRRQMRALVAPPAGASATAGPQVPAQTEVRHQLIACARMVLADVEAALRRMDEGGYGDCHLCGRAIAWEHLDVVPQARYCARCGQARGAVR